VQFSLLKTIKDACFLGFFIHERYILVIKYINSWLLKQVISIKKATKK